MSKGSKKRTRCKAGMPASLSHKRLYGRAGAVDLSGAPIPLARKTSELFLQFADPVLENVGTIKDMRNALNMAALAWNLALLSPEERESRMNRSLASFTVRPDELPMFRQVFSDLIERKVAYFGEVNRGIREVVVVPANGGRCHIKVIAIFPEEEVSNPHPEIAPEE